MSQTFDVTVANIRQWLRDTNPADYVFSTELLRRAINNSYQRVGREIGIGKATQTLTLIAGTKDYTVTGTTDVLSQLIRTSDNLPMEKLSLTLLNEYLAGATQPTGEPEVWSAWETSAQVATIRVAPIPTASQAGHTLILWRSPLATSLALSGSITLEEGACRAVELDVAIKLLLSATAEDVVKLRLDKLVVGEWREDVRRMIKAERVRMNRMFRGAHYELTAD